jgi:hypothetical protein
MRNVYKRFVLFFIVAAFPVAAKDSCVECHSVMEGSLQRPAQLFNNDVHKSHGFSCASCHGGDPSSDDPLVAMSPARGFLGKVRRTSIPKFCARCHSDATLMHKYDPQQRVDQYALYQTSVHGKRIAAGDAAAATCVDCHSVHDIRQVKDPLSPVHPLRIPETCSHCHSDPQHMAKYEIPTNQYAEYLKSVHWQALKERGDLSAPSCASCHGNHGATPPGVNSVANVCGTCHVLMDNMYQASPHKAAFEAMGMAGCVVCHNNHAVRKPSTRMLAGSDSVCSQCHDAESAGGKAAARMADAITSLDSSLDRSDEILNRAANSGMEVSEAELRQHDAREALVKARVAIHAFDVTAVTKPVNDGLKITAETYQTGAEALKERDRRRMGLGISLVTILITMTGLWLAIRFLEKPSPHGRQ